MVLPYVFGVLLKKSDGNPRANAAVRVTNKRTGDYLDGTTNDFGQVVFDLANFTNGYIVGDVITYEKYVTDSDMEYYVTANGTESNPTFVQVEDETRARIYPNSARIKLNLTRYKAGRNNVNITLN